MTISTYFNINLINKKKIERNNLDIVDPNQYETSGRCNRQSKCDVGNDQENLQMHILGTGTTHAKGIL